LLSEKFIIFQSGVFFTKFRISDHSLEIEKGRYNKTTCEERLCKNCGVIEEEAHFILKCKVNEKIKKVKFSHFTRATKKKKNR
jgi:hypothetical protein